MNISIKLYVNQNIYEFKVCVLLQNETFYNFQSTMVLALSEKLFIECFILSWYKIKHLENHALGWVS
jgi:hypothetical protein